MFQRIPSPHGCDPLPEPGLEAVRLIGVDRPVGGGLVHSLLEIGEQLLRFLPVPGLQELQDLLPPIADGALTQVVSAPPPQALAELTGS